VNRQPRRARHVDRNEVDAGFHQVGDERDVARQAIQLGDDQGRLLLAARGERVTQFRSVVALAALDRTSLLEEDCDADR
jgi:hypothetical protein